MTHADTSAPGDRRGGTVLLLIAAVLWSMNGVFIKHLFAAGLGGWSIAGHRSLIAFLFLTPFAVKRFKPIPNRFWVAATVIAFTAMCATFVIATTQTSAANAIFLQYTAPAWVFLLSPLLVAERATRPQFAAMLISLVGVAVIFFWQYEPGQKGLLIGLASGLVFGVQSVLFRRVRNVDPLVLVWLVCGGSALLLLPTAYATGAPKPTLFPALALIVMGVLQFALPYILYSAALGRVTAQHGILVVLLEPVANPVWVWLIVGEVPLISTVVGGAFILTSVIIVALMDRIQRRWPAPPPPA